MGVAERRESVPEEVRVTEVLLDRIDEEEVKETARQGESDVVSHP